MCVLFVLCVGQNGFFTNPFMMGLTSTQGGKTSLMRVIFVSRFLCHLMFWVCGEFPYANYDINFSFFRKITIFFLLCSSLSSLSFEQIDDTFCYDEIGLTIRTIFYKDLNRLKLYHNQGFSTLVSVCLWMSLVKVV